MHAGTHREPQFTISVLIQRDLHGINARRWKVDGESVVSPPTCSSDQWVSGSGSCCRWIGRCWLLPRVIRTEIEVEGVIMIEREGLRTCGCDDEAGHKIQSESAGRARKDLCCAGVSWMRDDINHGPAVAVRCEDRITRCIQGAIRCLDTGPGLRVEINDRKDAGRDAIDGCRCGRYAHAGDVGGRCPITIVQAERDQSTAREWRLLPHARTGREILGGTIPVRPRNPRHVGGLVVPHGGDVPRERCWSWASDDVHGRGSTVIQGRWVWDWGDRHRGDKSREESRHGEQVDQRQDAHQRLLQS